MDVWIVSLLLVATLVMLITEKVPVDLTAIGIMAALTVTGVLEPAEAVAGFANPAVVTVAAMFLISRGMIRTGAVGFLAERVIRLSRGRLRPALLILLLVVGLSSAFINNTPVVVLFIPVVMSLCCAYDLSPSKFLIPISYASILAGTCTLIGTSTNIIVSDLSAAAGYGPIGMFELAWVGLPVAVLGVGFLLWAAPGMMPDLSPPACEVKDGEDRRYLAELLVPADSRLRGRPSTEVFSRRYPGLVVLEQVRGDQISYPGRDRDRVRANDLLLVKASVNDLVEILHSGEAEFPMSEKGLDFGSGDKPPVVAELIIPPQSNLPGMRLADSYLYRDADVHIIAIKRSHLHFSEPSFAQARLRIGDILLIWCPESKLESMRAGADYIIVEDVHHQLVHRRKAPIAGAIFAGVLAAATFGLAEILVCALAGAFLMLATGCLQLRDGYRALQPNVLLLIAGTIALGAAMEKTGASRLYARAFLDLFDGFSPAGVLSAFILLTSVSTQILSNNATAVLLLPVAVSTALGLGVDPKPFIVAICFGASACFATPIGYQTNLLVYGPGGYRFSDFLKMGIPLNLLVWGLGSVLIPRFWPF